MDFGQMAPLVIVGLAVALVGWAMVHIAARIERGRAEHQVSKYGPPNSRAED